jgi:hypothetical protein
MVKVHRFSHHFHIALPWEIILLGGETPGLY